MPFCLYICYLKKKFKKKKKKKKNLGCSLIGILLNNIKTPVTHGWMYHQIAAGYQIWKIVSDLRIMFFISEHIRIICNILVASATDMKCPWGCHGKIKLLEFSVKGLQMPGVINIRK